MIDDATRSYLKSCYAAKFLYFSTLLNEFHETWFLLVHSWWDLNMCFPTEFLLAESEDPLGQAGHSITLCSSLTA